MSQVINRKLEDENTGPRELFSLFYDHLKMFSWENNERKFAADYWTTSWCHFRFRIWTCFLFETWNNFWSKTEPKLSSTVRVPSLIFLKDIVCIFSVFSSLKVLHFLQPNIVHYIKFKLKTSKVSRPVVNLINSQQS